MAFFDFGILGYSLTTQATLLTTLALLLYTLYGAIYRLYLSPVAHIPGPLLARLTFWNEFYYDVLLDGRYTFKIRDYHAKYGPCIRIIPYEVHIMDPDFYDDLYGGASKGKVNKWFWTMRMFGRYDCSAFDTLDHNKYRMRREPWNPYFSKASVSRLQPLLIQNCVNKLLARLGEYQAAGKPVIMTHAYACLTADVISEYSFPQGYGFLDERPNFEFNGDHYKSWMALSSISHLLKQFGWLFPVLDAMPLWLTKATSPETYDVIREQQALRAQTMKVAAQLDSDYADYKESTGRPSMMEAFMTSPHLPDHDKSPERINGEAVTTIGAGTLTSTHCLKHATYHLLANPSIFERFMTELEKAIPDPVNNPPDLKTLESIDYLMAVLYESLRLFSGVTHRLQRIFQDRAIVYPPGGSRAGEKGGPGAEVVIPPGNPISMTAFHMHYDDKPFPDHYTFNPDRWLPLNTNGLKLQKYLAPFGKGTRQCVGSELGKAEILTALSNVFLRFGRSMRMVDAVRERDIDCTHDVFNPKPSKGNNGLIVAFDRK